MKRRRTKAIYQCPWCNDELPKIPDGQPRYATKHSTIDNMILPLRVCGPGCPNQPQTAIVFDMNLLYA